MANSLDLIRSSNYTTIITIGILGAVVLLLLIIVTFFILIVRKIARLIALYSFPRFGVSNERRRRRQGWKVHRSTPSVYWSAARQQGERESTPAALWRRISLRTRNGSPLRERSTRFPAVLRQRKDSSTLPSHMKPWPQRKDLKVPKSIWNGITNGIEKLDALPSWLGPPPVDEMPQKTKEGVLGWDWQYAHRSRRITDYSNSDQTSEEDLEFNSPIHYTRYVKLAFDLLIYALGDDKMPEESERVFIERKIAEDDWSSEEFEPTGLSPSFAASVLSTSPSHSRRFQDMILRCLKIFERAKYGNSDIEKREYIEYFNNLHKILTHIKRLHHQQHPHMQQQQYQRAYFQDSVRSMT